MSALLFHSSSWSRGGSGFADREDLPPYILEMAPPVDRALMTAPMLGRPTDTSITISIVPAMPGTFSAECGSEPGTYDRRSKSYEIAVVEGPAAAVEVLLSDLSPATAYHYRIMRREDGGDSREVAGGSFGTQPARGSPFVFTIQADSHLHELLLNESRDKAGVYCRTLRNVLNDKPAFHIDMGDFAGIEWYSGGAARSIEEALRRYLLQRLFLGEISRSIPFYLVIGNHEGEQGWRREREGDSTEVFGALARKALIPNPSPDGFYSGSTEETACCGLRESYYAWEWGDALFVVLDPFWYTMTMPHRTGKYEPSNDAWDWTLGLEQYKWLYETLNSSDARWKFVFSHHVTGGYRYDMGKLRPYGRGGIVVAKYRVAGEPSFEWGGEDETGEYVFDEKRPGWSHGPVHDVMVAGGVDIFFHGHDHVYVHEKLDGIVYQACPQPANPNYNDGFYNPELYRGIKRNNSGHLRVTVSPDSVVVDYVRSVLPEDEPLEEDGVKVGNGSISHSFTLKK
ncbi:MAG: metallophosphoesterase [bacterium]